MCVASHAPSFSITTQILALLLHFAKVILRIALAFVGGCDPS